MKYAEALKDLFGGRIWISLAHMGRPLRTLYGYGEEYFDHVSRKGAESLRLFVSKAIEDSRPDIIHSHNAPDYLTVAANKVSGEIPVIHDTHEVLSLHHSGYFSSDGEESLSRYALEEKAANERSQGRVYATHGIGSYIQSRYQVNGDNDLVFRNYVSRTSLPRWFEEKLSAKDGQIHIAYVGCVTSLLKDSHYYLMDIFKQVANHRLHVHIHPTSNLITRSNAAYKALAEKNEFIHCHRHTDRRRLLKLLTCYDYGWAGLNRVRNKRHLDFALPNKVIEYVACGLPVLAFPHRAIRHFIERNRVGLVGTNVDDLAKKLGKVDRRKLESNVKRCAPSLVIEEKIGELVDLYHRLIDPSVTEDDAT